MLLVALFEAVDVCLVEIRRIFDDRSHSPLENIEKLFWMLQMVDSLKSIREEWIQQQLKLLPEIAKCLAS